MSPVPLLCLLEWQDAAHLPVTVEDLGIRMYSSHFCGFLGELPWLTDAPHPTASHRIPPVSFTSAWQEALLGRWVSLKNNLQADTLEHNPLPCHNTTVQLSLFTLPQGWGSSHIFHLCLTPSGMDKYGHPTASEAAPSSLSGPLRAPLTGVMVRRKQSPPRLPGTGEEKNHSFLTALSKEILSLVSSTSTL